MEKEDFAVERGYTLSLNEQVCKEVINETMCNGVVDFNEIGNIFSLSANEVKTIVAYNEEKLAEFVADRLLTITNKGIEVNKTGMLIVRNIAMAFDPQLNTEGDKYSKTI